MSNVDRYPECHMRTALGNCDPLGGFCTSVNEPICEALHKASGPQGEWIALSGMQPPELHGKHYCSNCGHILHLKLNGGVYNFCPNCGARMFAKDTNVPNKKGADDERVRQ